MPQVKVQVMLFNEDSIGAGEAFVPLAVKRNYQLVGNVSAGIGFASVDIEVSLSGEDGEWITEHTLELGLAVDVDNNAFETSSPWKYVRGNVTEISGTNAQVTLRIGNEPN